MESEPSRDIFLFRLKAGEADGAIHFDALSEDNSLVHKGIAKFNGDHKIKVAFGAVRPIDFTHSEKTTVLVLQRFQKGSIRILVPRTARVFNNDAELVVRDGVCDVSTATLLPPVVPTKFPFSVKLKHGGKELQESRLVSVYGGQRALIDLSDMIEPDKRRRTIEYWDAAQSTFSEFQLKMVSTESFSEKIRYIRWFNDELGSLPLLGVDPLASRAVVSLAHNAERFAKDAENARGPSAALKALARGLSGDPIGEAVDTVTRNETAQTRIAESIRALGLARVELTAKYDYEFPAFD